MNRSILLLVALLLLPWGAMGCRSCQGCLDYCGPLPDEPCDFMHRRNSILGGDKRPDAGAAAAEPTTAEQQGDENVPTPAAEPSDEPAPMPMPPEAGVTPQADPYALDDAAQPPATLGSGRRPIIHRPMAQRPVLQTAQGPMFEPPQW